MEITTMKQLRNEHRKSDGALSLKAFAKTLGAEGIIKRAHEAAHQTRSDAKKERTRVASAASKQKKSAAAAKTTTKAA